MDIYIASYASNKYIQHCNVLLASLDKVSNKEHKYFFYFFYSQADQEIIDKTNKTIALLTNSNIFVNLIPCAFGLEKVLKSKKEYISVSIYDKILIYNLIPDNVCKILFLDADIVLLKDPAELYCLNLEDRILGAVPDSFEKFPEEAKRTINLSDPSNYFNSGVMVIDLIRWRELEISRQALEFCITKGHLTKLHDQDAFNHVLNGNIIKINNIWNPRPLNYVTSNNGKAIALSKFEFYEKGYAALAHYSGPNKPWLYKSIHPMKKYYLDCLEHTGFKGYQYPDKNMVNSLRKFSLHVQNIFRLCLGLNKKYI